MYASLMPVADPGEGPSPPPPYFWTKLRPKGPKKVCGGGDHLPPLSKGLDDLPPPLSSTAYTCITCIVNQLHPVSQDSSLMWLFLLL